MTFQPHIANGTGKGKLARSTAGFQSAASLVLLVWLTVQATAQAAKLTGSQAQTPAPQEKTADPLGRSTPRGTFTGFVRAMHRDDFVSAARFMQVTAKQKPNTEALARELSQLMDRYFTESLARINDTPEGEVDDALPLDRERIGPLEVGGKKFDIILVRIDAPESGLIWLISSDTLAQVPAMHGAMEKTWIERLMPEGSLNHRFLGIPLAQWGALGMSIGIPFLLLWLLSRLLLLLILRMPADLSRRKLGESWFVNIRWPSIFVSTLALHIVSVYLLGFSLTFRVIYTRCMMVLLIVSLTWLVRRMLALFLERARYSMRLRGQVGTASLILLGQRVINVLIIVVAIFSILTITGVDTKTALAGVGIGGVALAFGAQKTVENLLGGVFLLTDKVLAVGDSCCISNRVGTVEDITLRSVRLRTAEQSLLSIPAGVLSQANIENFATRSKILANANLRLRYGTTAEQLRSVLHGVHKVLVENAKIEPGTARIQLVAFGERAIELELSAYVLTSDYLEFLCVREDLLLQVAAIVESSGTGFAMPTQFIYLKSKSDVDSQAEESPAPPELYVSQRGADDKSVANSIDKRARRATG
jgi:MscS family membrane protein